MNGLREVLCVAGLTAILAVGGCLGGDARVEMTAGDALMRVADEFEKTVVEYHGDITEGDAAREAEIASAFVARVMRSKDDEEKLKADTAAFLAACKRIREDREVEWERFTNSKQNVGILRDIGRSLSNFGLASLSLQDETRRYLGSWMVQYQTYRSEKAKAEAAASAEKRANRQAFVDQFTSLITTTPRKEATNVSTTK